MVENAPAGAGDVGSVPGSGRSPEKDTASHSSVLTRRTPWTEEPGGLQSWGHKRGGHNLATERQQNKKNMGNT